jgi:hypothetical protein
MQNQREQALLKSFRFMTDKEQLVFLMTADACAARHRPARPFLKLVGAAPSAGLIVESPGAAGEVEDELPAIGISFAK